MSGVISGVVSALFGPRPKLLNGSISLKFLLKTTLKSKSFDTFDDLLEFWFKSYDLK